MALAMGMYEGLTELAPRLSVSNAQLQSVHHRRRSTQRDGVVERLHDEQDDAAPRALPKGRDLQRPDGLPQHLPRRSSATAARRGPSSVRVVVMSDSASLRAL